MKTNLNFGFYYNAVKEGWHTSDPPIGKSVLVLVRSRIGTLFHDVRVWTGEEWIKTENTGDVVGWQRLEIEQEERKRNGN